MSKMSKSEAGKLGALKSIEIAKQKKLLKIAKYDQNPKICPGCGNPLSYEDAQRKKKFHNQSCSATFNNTKRAKKFKNQCLNCGKSVKEKFCDNKCQGEFSKLKSNELVLEGKGTSNQIKRYLLEQNDHHCWGCHHTEWQGQPIPLELEHKDGNSENNMLDNCELLCPNCHALTPTYKNRNKGNGRWKRRQRYVDGVSY